MALGGARPYIEPEEPNQVLPATGVSDSHRNTLESTGYFRTYVLGVGDGATDLEDGKGRTVEVCATNESVRALIFELPH